MGRSDPGARQDLDVLLGDARRQVRRDGLRSQELDALGVADRGGTDPSPLVATEDISEATGSLRDELDLLRALGEVDGEGPTQLPRPARREA